MHICVGNLTIIGSDNGLSPGRRQAIIKTNAGILSIGPLGTNFNEILIGIQTFSFKKMHFKMSSAKWRPFCLGLNVLNIVFTFSRSHQSWGVSQQLNMNMNQCIWQILLPNQNIYSPDMYPYFCAWQLNIHGITRTLSRLKLTWLLANWL